MAQNSKSFAASLKAVGMWADFCTYRDELCDRHTKAEATRLATERFAKAADAGRNILVSAEKGNGTPDPLPSAPADAFAGKPAATEAEVIRWVADNLAHDAVAPDDCPSRTAWALLHDCRQFPAFRIDFWKTLYTKLISKGQLDDGAADGDYDGAVQVDLIDRVRQLSAAAREAAT